MVKVPYLAGCHGNGRSYSLLRGSCPLFGPDITVCLHSHVLHLQFTVSPECNPRKRQSAAAVAEIARELRNVISDLQKVESISVIKKSQFQKPLRCIKVSFSWNKKTNRCGYLSFTPRKNTLNFPHAEHCLLQSSKWQVLHFLFMHHRIHRNSMSAFTDA